MKAQKLFDDGHQWYLFGRDPNKPDKIIDTNQYMVVNDDQAILLDPGGIELFAPMLAAVMKFVDVEQLTHLFASHQDPDIISSLGMWDQILPNATLHSPWLWEGFIRHFGMNNIPFRAIPDEGGQLHLGSLNLEFIPAHYLHSSGNFHVYDSKSKILFTGDVGAALEDIDAPLFVDDFDEHIDKMKYFHQRWMPSNSAKNEWVKRVRKLDIEMLLPQHGRIFKGENVWKFVDWFEALDVGIAVNSR
jgi:flavorubredoxin